MLEVRRNHEMSVWGSTFKLRPEGWMGKELILSNKYTVWSGHYTH